MANREIGAFIRRRRKEIRMTQTELAKKMGVTQSTISQIEKGLITPTITLLQQLSEHLLTTPSYFLSIYSKDKGDPKAEELFIAIQKANYMFNYQEMKALLEQAKKESLYLDPANRVRILIWDAMWHLQHYKLDEATHLCLEVLHNYQKHLSPYQAAEAHRLLGDVYCTRTLLLCPTRLLVEHATDPKVEIFLKEALYHYNQSFSHLKYDYFGSEEYKKVVYGLWYVYERLGEPEKGKEFYEQSWILHKKDQRLSITYEGYMLHNNACFARERGQYEEASRLFYQAAEHYERNENKRNMMTVYMDLGDLYEELGQTEKALKYYQKALDVLTRAQKPIKDQYAKALMEKLQVLEKLKKGPTDLP